jgi:uncharacterized protein YdeI (YjbR/CyaY-like superfamily)
MKQNPKVDAYILNAAPFAQPILNELRATLETAEPELEETIKWGFPCFTFQRKLICSFSAYKNHCVFRFWQGSNLDDSAGILAKVGETEMGELSKIKNLEDLPNSEVLIKYTREAIELSKKKSIKTIASEKKLTIDLKSADLPEIFSSYPKQAEKFDAFPPSHRKEYLSWITEAKTDATRIKRIETMMEWILDGKSRNWKYEKKK